MGSAGVGVTVRAALAVTENSELIGLV